ncbi:MAG: PilN domain-containing protein [candidate division Zixibacteria bacterium]|nr:PilN domain-containing protein [candidate division Zixibacteria bacterium]
MIEINLLPKGYAKRSFDFSLGKTSLYMIAGAAGVILMLIGITIYQWDHLSDLDKNIERARKRAAMLQKDIEVVDALEQVKVKISRRMAAVERLDSHRSVWVRILENIANNVPEFVWLARFNEVELQTPVKDSVKDVASSGGTAAKGSVMPPVRKAEIEGYTFTLNAMAAFMINMMRSDYFDEVELLSTTESTFDEHKAYRFMLSCNLHYLSDEEVRGLIGKTAGRDKSLASVTDHKSTN